MHKEKYEELNTWIRKKLTLNIVTESNFQYIFIQNILPKYWKFDNNWWTLLDFKNLPLILMLQYFFCGIHHLSVSKNSCMNPKIPIVTRITIRIVVVAMCCSVLMTFTLLLRYTTYSRLSLTDIPSVAKGKPAYHSFH